MRHVCLVLVLLPACGKEPMGDDDQPSPDASVGGPARGFRVVSPDIRIEAHQEITYCYYFKTPNTEELAIHSWASEMTPGSHHMIMYTTATEGMPAGTISSSGCGGFGATNVPSWTYAAQTPTATVTLPDNDGGGKPLAQRIAPATPAYFQMHYLNSTDDAIMAHVTLDAFALEANTTYTLTSPFITYNSQISIGPGATNDVETQTCNVPTGFKFWSMSTHAHKQAIKTAVKDGGTVVFESYDWEHPGGRTWMTTPFYTFASGQLTYECTYNNTMDNSGSTIVSGPSADTNEMCMAVGYYFPATKTMFCLNSSGAF